MSYIYSYRLTYFGGAAPCYDGEYLSLAICKRDMRRVIGDRISKEGENDIWVIGIVGKKLEESTKKNYVFTAEDILYIAKVELAKTFDEYFGITGEKRADKIYIPDKVGRYSSNGVNFRPTPNNGVHDEEYLWDRDWDIAHSNRGKYVLISKEYHFLSKGESEELMGTTLKGCKLAKGVGHTWFLSEDNELLKCLCDLTRKGNGVANLPEGLRSCVKLEGCGKDKSI